MATFTQEQINQTVEGMWTENPRLTHHVTATMGETVAILHDLTTNRRWMVLNLPRIEKDTYDAILDGVLDDACSKGCMGPDDEAVYTILPAGSQMSLPDQSVN